MKFVGIYTYSPEQRMAANSRFLESGGQPPEGITLIGRWHDASGGRGFSVLETDDPVALSKWASEWDDLLSMEFVPVVDDQQAAEVMGSQ